MRYTSLAVEMLRSRAGLVFWVVILAQAALWLLVPLIFYASPPGDVAQVLAVGREYRVGSQFGPPLAFWLADAAYRLAGGHMIGVYVLSQMCLVVSFWALYQFARAIAGAQHAVLAVLLTVTITAFGFPNLEFGPAIVARPLWALVLLHYWRAVGQGQRNAWFALSIEIGLLMLTSYAGIWLVVLLLIVTLAHERGRAALKSTDPLYALLVVVTLLAPFLIWLLQPATFQSVLPPAVTWANAGDNLMRWPNMLGAVVVSLAGVALLVGFNAGKFGKDAEDSPMAYRAPVDPFARNLVYATALAPPLVLTFTSALVGYATMIGGAGLALMTLGLAVVILAGDIILLRQQRTLRMIWAGILLAPAVYIAVQTLLHPWTTGPDLKTSLPATEMGEFFADSFARRTGQKLTAIAGDPQMAMLVAVGAPGRPHVFIDDVAQASPWITREEFVKRGGIVVWRVADSSAQVPAEIKALFPDLAPEVPRAFERWVQGRRPLLRIGWAVVRPQAGAR